MEKAPMEIRLCEQPLLSKKGATSAEQNLLESTVDRMNAGFSFTPSFAVGRIYQLTTETSFYQAVPSRLLESEKFCPLKSH
nr:hypothetical protein [uncultured Rhodoferax sp.]